MHRRCFATLTQSSTQFANSVTKKVIDNAARSPNHGWNHTKTHRGEERRLNAALKRAPTLAKTRFDAGPSVEVDSNFEAIGLPIEPGTFAEVRRNEQCNHGVVLAEKLRDNRWKCMTLMSSGEVWYHNREDAVFTIPKFVTNDAVSRCGASDIPTNSAENLARVSILKQIRELQISVERECISVGRWAARAYERIKTLDPNEWVTASVSEILQRCSPHPHSSKLITRFALHKVLMDQSKHFVADTVTYRSTQVFYVRPQAHVDTLDAVMTMSRHGSSYLDVFAKKAARIITANQKRAKDTRQEPPQVLPPDDPHAFTKQDTIILDFLVHSLRPRRTTQVDPYSVLVSRVMKAIGLFPRAIDTSLVHQVLVDLGVLAPWQDVISITSPATLTAHRPKQPSYSPKDGTSLGPHDLYPSDPVAHLRHDFGDMPVYVIDDVGAEELDDGVSIERTSSGETWVHVHIADPTALLPPTHAAALDARARMETFYFVQGTTPMLPEPIIRQSSLGRGAGHPEHVLTFSFQVDDAGEISKMDVRAGLVRNIRKLTYDAVDSAMGQLKRYTEHPFGGAPPEVPLKKIADAHIRDIEALSGVANRLIAARLLLPIFQFTKPTAYVTLSPKPLPSAPIDTSQSMVFRGFPQMSYAVHGRDASGSRGVVAELMKAACRVASRWCLERGVPAVRRAGARPTAATESQFAALLAGRDAAGMVEHRDILLADVMLPATEYTLEPAMHWILGVGEGEGYVRITSPLRRYMDLLMHWQIKRALLSGKKGGEKPFKLDELRVLLRELNTKEILLKQLKRSHDTFWSLLFVRRWMMGQVDNKEGLDPLQDIVGVALTDRTLDSQTKQFQCKVELPSLGIRGTLRELNRGNEVHIGDEVKVRAEEVLLGSSPSLMLSLRD